MAGSRKEKKKSRTKKKKSVRDNSLIFKILGGLVLLFSVFVLLASISYLFSWREDMSILNEGVKQFFFDLSVEGTGNIMGKLGAFFAHLFIYNGLG